MTPSPYGSSAPWTVRVPPNETTTPEETTMSEATTRPCGGIIRAPTGAAMDEEFPVLLDTTEPDYWLYIDLSEYNIAIAAGCDPECKESDVCGGPDYDDLLRQVAPYIALRPFGAPPLPDADSIPYTPLPPARDMGAPIVGAWRVTERGLEIRIVKTGGWPVTVTTRMPISEILTAIAAMVAREQEDA